MEDPFSLPRGMGTVAWTRDAPGELGEGRITEGVTCDGNEYVPWGMAGNLDGFLGLGYWYMTILSREIVTMTQSV
jgi:hypothetical protein